jgi:Fe-S cluster assembly scaffold protein SufB
VATTYRGKLAEQGIIFCSFGEAIQEHPELVKQYLGAFELTGFGCVDAEIGRQLHRATDAFRDVDKRSVAEQGIIFCSFGEAIQEHPELVKQYLGTVVPANDNFCLHRQSGWCVRTDRFWLRWCGNRSTAPSGNGRLSHPELVKQYLGTVVPANDNFFAALNSAVASDGTFVSRTGAEQPSM